jgi:hypothetical protein
MTRDRLVILFAVLMTFAAQRNGSAATIEMSMTSTTQSGTVTETSEVPVYEFYDNDGYAKYAIGYSATDPGYMWETSEGKVTLNGMLDPDPILSFGGAVIDFGAPSSFSFSFVLPLSPLINNPSIVSDSFAGVATNASGPGVTITALAPPVGIPQDGDGITEVQVYTLSDDGGATWKNVGLDQMPTTVVPLGVGGSAVVGPFSGGPIATIPGGPWTHMRADVNFQLSGGGDLFAFNGSKVLVPEPGSFGLLLLVMTACAACRRRAT